LFVALSFENVPPKINSRGRRHPRKKYASPGPELYLQKV